MFTEILSQQDIQGHDNKFQEKYLGIAYWLMQNILIIDTNSHKLFLNDIILSWSFMLMMTT